MTSQALIQLYFSKCDQLERTIFEFLTVGWTPKLGFETITDSNGIVLSRRSVFDISTDIDRIPSRAFPLTRLSHCLVPCLIYLVIILVGLIRFQMTRAPAPAPAQKKKKQKLATTTSRGVLFFSKFIYNFIQIFLCAYMCIQAFVLKSRHGMYFIPLSRTQIPNFNFTQPTFIMNLLWLFYISKILDFCDTMFIIISNKRLQFTFLHCYHHVSIYLIYWININMNYDGDVYFTILLNSFIHAVMYTYYLISMHIPKMIEVDIDRATVTVTGVAAGTGTGTGTETEKKVKVRVKYSVWWKKYLTVMQLTQFILMLTQGFVLTFIGCAQEPPRVILLYLVYIVSIFLLFLKFFRRTYQRKSGSGNDKGAAKSKRKLK